MKEMAMFIISALETMKSSQQGRGFAGFDFILRRLRINNK